MFLSVSDEYLAALSAEALRREKGVLRGDSSDEGSVVRLLQPGNDDDAVVGRWQHPPLDPATPDNEGTLIALIDSASSVSFVRRFGSSYIEQPYERLSLFADYHSRTVGLFDSRVLHTKTVTVIGLGTGGAICATELAKAGVGNFRLVDFDRLAVHNIARHVCGLRDLGRLKTDALRDHLRNTNPAVEITTYPFDITSDLARLEEVIRGSDLVIGATDSEPSKSAINRYAWTLGVPAVYGAAYEMGFGGDVLRVLPPDDACYECFRTGTAEMFQDALPEIADYGHIAPQPALGLDVTFPALILARVALTLLLQSDPTAHLEPYNTNWVLWSTQPRTGWVFEEPLQARFVEVPPDPLCPICHRTDFLREELGMNNREVEAEAQNIFDNIPTLPPTHS